ncbi:organic cation transporter protein isoform X3 [Nilaparvata lugens]|uniref:organic cation transporter protein isoform X2 n=1 Tax=Nilaparvata lugens TaxID=108931 RepID=UPI00193E3E05|nr:organic cation transporter protein isoform X2 [Nilaparvata lugens]XP_022199655.2 organic cation transporter protein isoform X3 [Nilaparvata lugens]
MRLMMERETSAVEAALDRVGSHSSWWLWGVFALTTLPGAFNAMHIMSYVFLTDVPPHWCQVSQLQAANWTQEQIRNVSSPEASESNCFKYDWNYTLFASIGYNETLDYISKATHKPKLIECLAFDYEESSPKSSIVSEWDLVCHRSHLRSFSQVTIAFGKFVGGFLFGVISDKYGRKLSFAIATLLYMTAGPLAALVPSFIIFNIARFTIGIAGSGVYETSYTILTEIAVKRFRTLFGCVFNISYPVGYILLPLAAWVSTDWRQLQLYISLPLLILMMHFWLLPESPRWLLSKGRKGDAWKILEKAGGIDRDSIDRQERTAVIERVSVTDQEEPEGKSAIQRLLQSLKKVFSLYGTSEIRRRIIVCYIAWFSAAMSYYAIALNADNFTANKYIYCALNGAVEAPGYVVSFICLSSFGRKPVSSLLFLISGSSLLFILLIPQDYQMGILLMALLGRFCISAVFAVIILQTSELFPTINRNSAIGTSLTVCQLGAVAAPYVVDFMGGKEYWYLPSTLCGILSILTAILVASLPETKDKPLANTVEDIDNQSEKVSFLSFFKLICFCR